MTTGSLRGFVFGALAQPLASIAARWDEQVIEFTPGDALLVYTDGVTDTPSGRERFGEARLLAAIPNAAAPAAMLSLQLVRVPDAQVAGEAGPRPEAAVH